MPKLISTPGRLMVDSILPDDLRDQNRVLDKKGVSNLLHEVALRYPERYREISHELAKIGADAAQSTGGFSFGLEHLRKSQAATKRQQALAGAIDEILERRGLSEDEKDQAVIDAVVKAAKPLQSEIFDESLKDNNPLAYQLMGAGRGNKTNLATLRGGDMLYVDHRNRPIPFAVMRSYSQGLTPAEYWAGAYGARKGIIDLKLSTRDAGFLGKQLSQVVHRQLVTALDADKPYDTVRGYPVDASDDDNEGALLAAPAGGYAANTVLTPKILADIRRKGTKRLLLRSPMVGGPEDGGVYARDVGYREFGRMPAIGENPSLAAVQALAEPVSQSAISSKHGGGIAISSQTQAATGFTAINQLIQVPKTFKSGAVHAENDGRVGRVEDSPTGGKVVIINGQEYHVHHGVGLKVQPGDRVEAGDVISEGIPNPSIITKHKGIGDGRRYFVNALRQALVDAGFTGHRRNMELLARGLINHVKVTDEFGDHAPDDIITYQQLEHSYKPRDDFRQLKPKESVGKYLERPYLHYTIGTKVRPSMVKDFDDFGVTSLDVHDNPPPFEPHMVRGMANLSYDQDWMTQMFGSGLKSSLLKSTHRGATSDPTGTSFVPGLARAVDFGDVGKVTTPHAPGDKPKTYPNII